MATTSILVVDDLEPDRKLLEAILTPLGYTVSFATNGEEALQAVRTNPPNLVLMDITMPILDGYAACRALKEDPTTSRIPVIMVTGQDDPDDIRKALHHGADDYIMKPINQNEVTKKVQWMLDRAKTGKLPGQFYFKFRKGSTPPNPSARPPS